MPEWARLLILLVWLLTAVALTYAVLVLWR